MLRERRRERHPRTNHPARPRERRLHRGPQPAVVLRTGEGEGAENGEKRATTRKTETAKGFGSAGSRARRRTKATEATGQGARSTSARVGHHANVERGARREQDTSCTRGGSRDAGRRHLTPVICTKKVEISSKISSGKLQERFVHFFLGQRLLNYVSGPFEGPDLQGTPGTGWRGKETENATTS